MTAAVTLASNASIMTEPTGTAPAYQCRAWVNFNGTGTVAIRASGNVSSITDNGVGDYTVNFATAMPDANFSVAGTCGANAASYGAVTQIGTATGSVRTVTMNWAGNTPQDYALVCMSIFR
jgi:hypothetical protein